MLEYRLSRGLKKNIEIERGNSGVGFRGIFINLFN